MELIVSNKFYEILYDQSKSIMVIRWKHFVVELTATEYKNKVLDAHEYLHIFLPEKLIHDSTNAVYPPTEDMNKWLVENISPIYKRLGIKKIAYVYPRTEKMKNFVSKVVKDAANLYIRPERKLFPAYEQALRWVMD